MDRGAWGTTVHGVTKELDTVEQLSIAQHKLLLQAFLVALVVKNPPAKAGDIRDMSSVSGLGRSPGG